MPQASSTVESLCRSIKRSPGFGKLIINSIEDIDEWIDNDESSEMKACFKFDKERFHGVAGRIIRGLFFKEKKYPLPINYQVITKIQEIDFQSLKNKFKNISFKDTHIIQEGIFCYTYAETIEDTNSTMWLLSFYENLSLFCATRSLK